jgi:hypothetical protein
MCKRNMNGLRSGSNSCTDVYLSLGLSSRSVIYKRKEFRIVTVTTRDVRWRTL